MQRAFLSSLSDTELQALPYLFAYGTGTLMSALSRLPIAPRPPVLTRDYLHCLAFVAITIADATDHTFDIGDGTLSGLQRTP